MLLKKKKKKKKKIQLSITPYYIDGSALQIWRAPGENQPQKFVGPK